MNYKVDNLCVKKSETSNEKSLKTKNSVIRTVTERTETCLRPPTQCTYIPRLLCAITQQSELGMQELHLGPSIGGDNFLSWYLLLAQFLVLYLALPINGVYTRHQGSQGTLFSTTHHVLTPSTCYTCANKQAAIPPKQRPSGQHRE